MFDEEDWSSQGPSSQPAHEREGPSPQRKKRPPNMFKVFGRGVSSLETGENAPPSLFNASQDSQSQFSQSQFSQDFTDRFQMCGIGMGDMDGAQSLIGHDDSLVDSSAEDRNPPGAEQAVASGGRISQIGDSSQEWTQTQSQPYDLNEAREPPPPPQKHRPMLSVETRCSTSMEGIHGVFPFGGQSSLTATGTPLSATAAQLSGGSTGSGVGGSMFNFMSVGQSSRADMPPPSQGSAGVQSSSASTSARANGKERERERLINLASPLDNPFLQEHAAFDSAQAARGKVIREEGSSTFPPASRKSSRRPPQSVFIGAFQERPRFVCDFEHLASLGEGAHSAVFKARRRLDGVSYAVKKLSRRIGGEREGALMVKEAMAFAALQGCPHMVQYYGCWLDDNHLFIQTEACCYGSLDAFLAGMRPTTAEVQLMLQCRKESVPEAACDDSCSDPPLEQSQKEEFLYSCSQDDDDLSAEGVDGMQTCMDTTENSNTINSSSMTVGISEDLAWQVLRDIGAALQFMHHKGVAHLDLRPANIFITRSAWEEGPVAAAAYDVSVTNPTLAELQQLLLQARAELRLGDLGQSCRLDEQLLNEGEARYMPREVLGRTRGLDLTKIDMFSLGATVYELVLGRKLGSGDEDSTEWHSLRDGTLSAYVERRYSSTLVNLLRNLLSSDPSARPSATDVFLLASGCPGSSAGATPTAELQRLQRENAHLRAMLQQREYAR